MNKLNFVFFTFGEKIENYTLCAMAILSAKKFVKDARFIIYTDRPQLFAWADFLTIKELSKEQIQDWRGTHNYLLRVKLKSVEDAVNSFEGHIVYMDSDIFVKAKLDTFIEELNSGKTFMHLKEGPLKNEKAQMKQDMFNTFKGKTTANILLSEDMEMWNSGIIALPHSTKKKLVSDALKINDDLCGTVTNNYLVEQFSFSISLKHNSNLNPCDSLFTHYWGNKPEWHDKIEKFLSKAFIKNLTIDQIVDEIDLNYWGQLPINRSKKSFNKRITKFANKHFPDDLLFTRN